jgi:F1F0 ATPase subunit 2
MSIDTLAIGVGIAWGALLGFFFIGGLWWSLKGISSRHHPQWFLGFSFLVRTLSVLAGFWWALHHSVTALLGGVAGFALMRHILTRRLGAKKRGGETIAN